MKKLLFSIILLAGCSSDGSKIGVDKELAKENIWKYINANLGEAADENNHIDEISILKIDTLTEKSIIQKKMDGYLIEFAYQEETVRLNQEIFDLSDGFGEDVIKVYKRKLDESNIELESIRKSYKDVMNGTEKADSIAFKYYMFSIKFDYTEKAAAKSNELDLFLNSKFQVVEWKDL